jgi:hypothetical protein
MAPRRRAPTKGSPPLARQQTDGLGLLQHPLGLGDDALADAGDGHLARPALEQADPELVLQLANRHAQGGLADEAGLGGPSEVALPRHGDDVAELVERHTAFKLFEM